MLRQSTISTAGDHRRESATGTGLAVPCVLRFPLVKFSSKLCPVYFRYVIIPSEIYLIGRLTERVGRVGGFQVLGLLERLEALHEEMLQALAGFASRYLREVDRSQHADLALEIVIIPLPFQFALESVDVLSAHFELFLEPRRRLRAGLLKALQALLQPGHLLHQLVDLEATPTRSHKAFSTTRIANRSGGTFIWRT